MPLSPRRAFSGGAPRTAHGHLWAMGTRACRFRPSRVCSPSIRRIRPFCTPGRPITGFSGSTSQNHKAPCRRLSSACPFRGMPFAFVSREAGHEKIARESHPSRSPT